MGVIGVLALAAVIFFMCRRARRRSSGASDTSSDASSALSFEKPGLISRWRNGLPGGNADRPTSPSQKKKRGAPTKGSIGRPTRVSLWPNFWKRTSSALSFKDVGGPALPPGVAVKGAGRDGRNAL
jgi:hypothetical protein